MHAKKQTHFGLELGVGIAAIAALVLAGCGGGGGGSGTPAAAAGTPAGTPVAGAPAAGSASANIIATATSIGLRTAATLSTASGVPAFGFANIEKWTATATANVYLSSYNDFNYTPASGVAAAAWTPNPTVPQYQLDTGGWTTANLTTTNANGTISNLGETFTVVEAALAGTALKAQTVNIDATASAVPGVFPANAKAWTPTLAAGTTVDHYFANPMPAGVPDANLFTAAAGVIPSGLTLAVAQTHNTKASPLCSRNMGFVYQGPSPTTAGAGRFAYYPLTLNAGAFFPSDCTNSTIAAAAAAQGTVDMQQLAVNGATVLQLVNEIPATVGSARFSLTIAGRGTQASAAVCLPAPATQCTMGSVLLKGYLGFTAPSYNKVAMDAMMTAMGLPLF